MNDRQVALEKRNRLIAKIMPQYDMVSDFAVLPVVPLDDFFDGNWDEWSFANRRAGHDIPPLQECYQILAKIRDRPDVQDVLIAIHESPEADEPLDDEIWPDSDTVYVLASFTEDEFVQMTKQLVPDDAYLGTWSCRTGIKPPLAPELKPGHHVFVLWWD
ncbi:hypothetical protein K9N68_09685 [Kovacikia minuta CCNUW1]|uniref:hypothetical protein n=1 Tax=Kovacikia minuta TaxID=2931930 RepID=UPI001CC8F035|nr:hypothetical protein [Kovacikia minuta]UBF28124.1 hypothetical protein K9N68_09685 [Kovacikia minuta CCNUW1]